MQEHELAASVEEKAQAYLDALRREYLAVAQRDCPTPMHVEQNVRRLASLDNHFAQLGHPSPSADPDVKAIVEARGAGAPLVAERRTR